ncbi:MAG: hypothetical protein ACD_21C00046G0003, partial [uncultured bacterium]
MSTNSEISPELKKFLEACAELRESEERFRNDLGKGLQLIAGAVGKDSERNQLLEPHRILSKGADTMGLPDRSTIELMFAEGRYDEVVTQICEKMEHFFDTTQEAFMDANFNTRDIQRFCEKYKLKLPANSQDDFQIKLDEYPAALLPSQRLSRYELLLEAIAKEGKNYITAEVLEKLKTTTERSVRVWHHLNLAMGVKNFFGKDKEMVDLFDKLEVTIPIKTENDSNLAKRIAKELRSGASVEDLAKTLNKGGIKVDAGKLKSEYGSPQLLKETEKSLDEITRIEDDITFALGSVAESKDIIKRAGVNASKQQLRSQVAPLVTNIKRIEENAAAVLARQQKLIGGISNRVNQLENPDPKIRRQLEEASSSIESIQKTLSSIQTGREKLETATSRKTVLQALKDLRTNLSKLQNKFKNYALKNLKQTPAYKKSLKQQKQLSSQAGIAKALESASENLSSPLPVAETSKPPRRSSAQLPAAEATPPKPQQNLEQTAPEKTAITPPLPSKVESISPPPTTPA